MVRQDVRGYEDCGMASRMEQVSEVGVYINGGMGVVGL